MSESPPRSRAECPECGHQFKGNGFDGIDAHWRAKHEGVMPYKEAWPLIKSGSYTARVRNQPVPQRAVKSLQVASPITRSAPVSPSQLADWRRRLVQLLARLEHRGGNQPQAGVAVRIARLSRAGVIPREIAAVMLTITEMRNATEYESKTLTSTESALIKAAWEAIKEWAESRHHGI